MSESTLANLLIASLGWHLGLAADTDEHTDPDDAGASWTDDAVLNACRAWQRVRTGHWSSKVAAGEQVLADLPDVAAGGTARPDGRGLDRAVVRQAVAARAGGVPPRVPEARGFQRQVLASLERSAAPRQ